MLTLYETGRFTAWFNSLRDQRAKARIDVRLKRLRAGNPGNSKSIGSGLFELRIDYGPGYRVYFIQRGARIVLLLCGGDKASQPQDIAHAKRLAVDWKETADGT